ncbi:hypothetical protein [Neobacillus rhizophilus]|uniref:Uncharacterized protein n=1 Tax=Neobacillus rhizophilus TaxID=2833579 RepID=A0A942U3V6_9BACI|nr:hypothetical protein [Neobacillus rhizophilus]MBS4212735.1 hypothetical protein [Neobacillus rhizophilus]MBU8915162.1 hypothetical protein [Bacillus sp. FJAT-29953]
MAFFRTVGKVEDLDTRNDHLNGDLHPETGVPFIEKTVELPSGEYVTGTIPVSESGRALPTIRLPGWYLSPIVLNYLPNTN